MDTTSIHIGALDISTPVFEWLKYITATILGAIITYFVQKRIMLRKEKQDRHLKFQDKLNEAYKDLINRLTPIGPLTYRVPIIYHDFTNNRIDETAYNNKLEELGKKIAETRFDIPPEYSILLDKDYVKDIIGIEGAIYNVRTDARFKVVGDQNTPPELYKALQTEIRKKYQDTYF